VKIRDIFIESAANASMQVQKLLLSIKEIRTEIRTSGNWDISKTYLK